MCLARIRVFPRSFDPTSHTSLFFILQEDMAKAWAEKYSERKAKKQKAKAKTEEAIPVEATA